MAKKKAEEGAPAYMALMAGLWIIMLAFFILLNTMATVQEAGFKAGIGKVKNAFGHMGGMGILNNLFLGKGGAASIGDSPTGEQGMDDKSMRGKGGGNNTDLRFENSKVGEYVRIKIPYSFPPGSATLTPEIEDYLDKAGGGFSLLELSLAVKNYSGDADSYEKRVDLSMERANNIKARLKSTFRYPEDMIKAEGYPDVRYLSSQETERKELADSRQATFFFIFQKR